MGSNRRKPAEPAEWGDELAEPSRAELAAIEAEWPLIEAELVVVDALARLAAEPAHEWLWRRHRRAVRRVLLVARSAPATGSGVAA
ncbi:MAG TPA: DUF6284 family protein [Mycobacteriales bacterium]|nr:DUF6284 family protein [Mycobacteriales bacterium]